MKAFFDWIRGFVTNTWAVFLLVWGVMWSVAQGLAALYNWAMVSAAEDLTSLILAVSDVGETVSSDGGTFTTNVMGALVWANRVNTYVPLDYVIASIGVLWAVQLASALVRSLKAWIPTVS